MRQRLIHRFARNAAIVSMLILAAVGIGSAGYRWLGELPWLDSAVNAVMILTGMGPVNALSTRGAKVFAMGRFHLDLSEQDPRKTDALKPSLVPYRSVSADKWIKTRMCGRRSVANRAFLAALADEVCPLVESFLGD